MSAFFARLLAAVLLGLLAAAPEPASPFAFDATPGRLPKDVVPRAYRIAIVPHLDQRRFDGRETVVLDVRAPVRTLVFDSLGETLRDVRFDGRRVAAVHSDDAAQRTTVRLARVAARGTHALSFAYRGRLEREARGLFIQSYTRADGSPGQMLATQFESIDARRMFPGWDEPAFRATFVLTVTLPRTWSVVGNMPIATRAVHGALVTTTFARTPPMATYLLALCAGDLVAFRSASRGTSLTVWATRGSAGEAAYPLQIARDTLADDDDYFGIAYPLPKLDSIAIPGGFPGAMENWGAITYDAPALLADASSPLAARQNVYSFMTHEMAHQWTGDLVSPAWWNDIWLNESFANWRSAAQTDARNPRWHWWELQDGDKESAMAADALLASHPLVAPRLDERMADAAFDGPITYSKGQAFLRMLEAYVGPERFRAGLRRYVRAHAYSNATSADLYAALSAASGLDVARFAHGWTSQAGFPLVTVRATCAADGARTIALAQRRFLLDGGDDGARWAIPLHVRAGDGPERRLLLTADGTRLAAGSCDEPLVVNAGATGYFRTAFDAATLATDTAAFATLPEADKIVLLDDQWALASSGVVPLATYLTLVRAIGDDPDERLWTAALDGLDAIALAERDHAGEAAYLAFARRIATPLAARLGWNARPGEPPADANLRPLVLERLGDWGDPATLAAARARFDRIAAGTSPAGDAGVRGVVERLVARTADAATFAQMLRLAGTGGDGERAEAYDALMRVRDPGRAAAALRIAVSPAIPPSLDDQRLGWVLAVADAHPALAWTTFCDHAAQLLAPQAAGGPETVAAALPVTFWKAVPLPAIARWLDAHAPTERTIGIPRGIERAEIAITMTPRLIAAADAYVAGSRSGTSARMSSRSGMASRNAPTMRGSKPKPASFSICSTAMLTEAASRHGRREVSAENVSATATTRAKRGIATP